jgi:AcrR family transcriptional regulator
VDGSARRRLPPEERREQLLDAALAAAAGRDLAAISVEELAATAGVSEGLLYHYFPNKQALLVAAIRRAAGSLLADLRGAAGGGPDERLLAGLDAYLDHVEAQPTSWRALLQAHGGELAEIGAEIEAESLALTLDALGITDPSTELLVAFAAWAALERQLCLGWLDHPEIPRDRIRDLLIASFVAIVDATAPGGER